MTGSSIRRWFWFAVWAEGQSLDEHPAVALIEEHCPHCAMSAGVAIGMPDHGHGELLQVPPGVVPPPDLCGRLLSRIDAARLRTELDRQVTRLQAMTAAMAPSPPAGSQAVH